MENTGGGCFLRGIAWVNIIIVFTIMLDVFIPADEYTMELYDRWYTEMYRDVSTDNYGIEERTSSMHYIRSADGEKFYLPDDSVLIDYLKPQDTFYIEKTPIFEKSRRNYT